jgi:hypothetical protein
MLALWKIARVREGERELYTFGSEGPTTGDRKILSE